MVDLPAPERPVYQRTQARCCLSAARALLFTSIACQWTFWARRRAKCSIPAPTVSFESRSMTMKPPVSWFTS